MLKKIIGISFVLIFQISYSAIGMDSSQKLNYEEAWKVQKFSGPGLREVKHLLPSSDEYKLSDSQKNYLVDSPALTNLRVLNLKNQNLTDDFIEQLCSNPTFSRVTHLDLSDNPNLTTSTLEFISNSNFIGSIRDFPQLSEKYKVPSSEIHITVSGTGIDLETIEKYNQVPQNMSFFIRYLDPHTGKSVAKSSTNAIKWLRIEQFYTHTHCDKIGNFCHHQKHGHACLRRKQLSERNMLHFIKKHLGNDITTLDMSDQNGLNSFIIQELAENQRATGITFLDLQSSNVRYLDIEKLLLSRTFGSLLCSDPLFSSKINTTPTSIIQIEIGHTKANRQYKKGKFNYPLPLIENFEITFYSGDFENLQSKSGCKKIILLDHGKELLPTSNSTL